MKAVAHASPVTALHLLNVEGSAEDQQTQHHYADKTEVHSPQYVFFDFHSSSEFFSCFPTSGLFMIPASVILMIVCCDAILSSFCNSIRLFYPPLSIISSLVVSSAPPGRGWTT